VSLQVAVPRAAGLAAGATLATMGTMLAGQLYWIGHRSLPTQVPPRPLGHVVAGQGPPLRVVALGDSTLTGPGLANCEQVWLPAALSMVDTPRSIHYVSLAVGGSRVADAARRVPDALRLEPDLVVVAVGANDALHGVPVHRIRSRLDGLLRSLLRDVDVIAVANIGDLGNIARAPTPLSVALRLRARRVRRTIERVAATHERVVLLDVTSADAVFRDRGVFTPDLFHPGPDGHVAWAHAVLPQLRVAVERAGSSNG